MYFYFFYIKKIFFKNIYFFKKKKKKIKLTTYYSIIKSLIKTFKKYRYFSLTIISLLVNFKVKKEDPLTKGLLHIFNYFFG